jgi:hypothetical protein
LKIIYKVIEAVRLKGNNGVLIPGIKFYFPFLKSEIQAEIL